MNVYPIGHHDMLATLRALENEKPSAENYEKRKQLHKGLQAGAIAGLRHYEDEKRRGI